MTHSSKPGFKNAKGDSAGAKTDAPSIGESTPSWHTLPVADAAARLGADLKRGLSESEAATRRKQYGLNALQESKTRSPFSILADQFKSLIVALLLAATVLAFVLGEHVEGAAVLVVIVLNAAVGFFTEWKAEQALNALQQQAAPSATVLRDGQPHELPSAELVPGDIVILAAGERVPADGRLVDSVQLQIDEASLTGESHAVEKIEDVVTETNAPLGDRRNMAFLGTIITDGRGRLLVTETGSRTEMGRIGTLIEEAVSRKTPLERKLAKLGNALIGVVGALCAVIVLAGWLRGNAFLLMLEVGISLAIAAVPEGLPAVTTMTLALGMRRMARMGALIRRLPAVETLGSTTVICTDKTGTLTRNEMTVQVFQLGDREVTVSGVGYTVVGEFQEAGHKIAAGDDAHLALALRIGVLCSDATLDDSSGAPAVLGDPTEGALLVAAMKAGFGREQLTAGYPRIGEVPFSSETKRMTTVHRSPEGKTVAFVKGGPGVITENCTAVFDAEGVHPLSAERREQLLAESVQLAGRALRILALAYKELPAQYSDEDLAGDLILVGMVGMIDPLRNEAKEAISRCKDAGIRTVMITGDQEATAAEIGRQLGLDRDSGGRAMRTAHGRELADLDAGGWREIVAGVGVFARVSPEHKLRIVEGLQAEGEVVAMTGDGVNDAPALKKADIGIAMGIKGTEVAKEAAAMVITDDDFATIVSAVEQGRIIYANILKFVHYLFSCNLAEILVVFIALMIGWPVPLAPLQILWLNMLTDVFPALALALEPSSPDAMKRPPRDPREPLMTPSFVGLIAWQGMLLGGLSLLAFWIGMGWYGEEGTGLRHATTMSFMVLALAQVFHAFNARSPRRSVFTDRLFTNAWLWAAVAACLLLQIAAVYAPFLQAVLRTTPLSPADWAVVLGCALVPVGVVELVKLGQRAYSGAADGDRGRAS
jgi:Ca2+-transporting ATPase